MYIYRLKNNFTHIKVHKHIIISTYDFYTYETEKLRNILIFFINDIDNSIGKFNHNKKKLNKRFLYLKTSYKHYIFGCV